MTLVLRTINKHIYELDTVVIGSCTRAAYYSFINKLPIINNSLTDIPIFDKLELSSLPDNQVKQQITKLFETKDGLIPEYRVRDFLLTSLSLDGLNMMSGKPKNIRISDDIIKVVTQNSRLIKIRCNNLIFFDDEGVEGVDFPYAEKNPKNRVLDWFRIESGASHNKKLLLSDEDFVKEVHFPKFDSFKHQKYLAAVSFLTNEEARDPENSGFYMRYKIIDMMKKSGIMGMKNGIHKKTGEQIYLPIKLDYEYREVIRNNKFINKTVNNITFNGQTLKQIFNE